MVIPRVREIDVPLFGLIMTLQILQSVVPKDLIKILDDGNPTILPVWDPMVCFRVARAFDRLRR